MKNTLLNINLVILSLLIGLSSLDAKVLAGVTVSELVKNSHTIENQKVNNNSATNIWMLTGEPTNRAFLNNQQSNRRLIREIRHELLTLPYYGVFDWLAFEVGPNSIVTLTGQVTRPTLKSDAEGVLKDIEGIASINNEIEVLPVSPNDDRLRIALYRNIYSGPLFRYSVGALNSIHIIVRRGHVTLKGYVQTEGDRTIANLRANTVSGVFSVKNELVAENQQRR